MTPYAIHLDVTWAKAKSCYTNCGSVLHWSDLGTEYCIVVGHGPFTYKVTITKEDPRSADQADFEDNYKV